MLCKGGGIQSFIFGDKDRFPPPLFHNLSAPYENEPELDKYGKQVFTKGEKGKVKLEYILKAKVISQLLCEREL